MSVGIRFMIEVEKMFKFKSFVSLLLTRLSQNLTNVLDAKAQIYTNFSWVKWPTFLTVAILGTIGNDLVIKINLNI